MIKFLLSSHFFFTQKLKVSFITFNNLHLKRTKIRSLMILRLTIEENLIHRNINSSNSLIQRKMISRFQMENSRITIGLSAPFLEFIPPRDGEGRIYPRTISGAYFIFSDPWPCNLRVGEWGWVNWADASEIESTIESKSSSLRVTYALVWVSGRCPSSLLRPFHFFPFTPPQSRGCTTPGMCPGASRSFFRVLRTYPGPGHVFSP